MTPIRPKVFPHSAIPFNRSKATDIMSRSLNPNMDGLALRNSMIMSSTDANTIMSKSIASFHLTGKKTMNTSVDRLFDTADNVFTGSAYGDLPTIIEKDMSSISLNKENGGLKDATKRPSTDSLNKPFLSEKNENDDRTHSPGSRSHSPAPSPVTPQNSSSSSHLLSHHPLHHNISAVHQGPNMASSHPKHNVPLPSLPEPEVSHKMGGVPGMRGDLYQPQQFNNNITSNTENSELYNIYQRRQQHSMQYNNNTVNRFVFELFYVHDIYIDI